MSKHISYIHKDIWCALSRHSMMEHLYLKKRKEKEKMVHLIKKSYIYFKLPMIKFLTFL